MRYICIETSLQKGFVTLFSDNQIETEFSWKEDKHSQKLIQSLNELKPYLRDKKKKIQFIAVDIGPGRFTGIRLGVNFAKALAYYLDIPLAPYHSLRIITQPCLKNNELPVLCMLEAFGNMFYVSAYKKINNQVQVIIPPSALSLKDIETKISETFICVGDVYTQKRHLFSDVFNSLLRHSPIDSITSQDFSNLIQSEWDKKILEPWWKVEPLYLRVQGFVKNSTKD